MEILLHFFLFVFLKKKWEKLKMEFHYSTIEAMAECKNIA